MNMLTVIGGFLLGLGIFHNDVWFVAAGAFIGGVACAKSYYEVGASK